MKHRKLTTVGLILVGLVLVSSLALAQGPMSGSGWGHGRGPGAGSGYCYAPDLTEEQITQLNKLRSDFYNDTAALRGQMATKRAELRALMINPEATPDEIGAKQKEILHLRTQFAEKRITHQAKMRGVLNKEQLRQLGGWGRGPGFGHGWRHHHGYGPGKGMGNDPEGGPYCPRH